MVLALITSMLFNDYVNFIFIMTEFGFKIVPCVKRLKENSTSRIKFC